MQDRQRVSSGSPYEDTLGFCRGIRVGDRVLVAGTAPIWPSGEVDPDAEAQAARCLDIILAAMADLGASAADVVRTRMFVTDAAVAGDVGRAHAAAFDNHRPVSTIVVVAGLLDPRWKVEIEAEAVVSR